MDDALWERLLAFDEASHAYFAEREEWPGAVVFTCRRADEFNLALIRGDAAPDPGALLEAIVHHYHRQGLTPRIRVTPRSRPADWPERLERRGFIEQAEAAERFMLLSREQVSAASAARPAGPDVVVCRAVDDAARERMTHIVCDVFGVEAALRPWMLDLARRPQAADASAYLAYLNGEPAGAATTRRADGITGIYGVATLEQFRRRGVCSALIRRIVEDSRSEGHGTIYLSTHPGSYAEGLYTRLGFAPLFTVHTYELPRE